MNHRVFIGMLIGLTVWAGNGAASPSTNAAARSVAFVLRRPASPRPISPLIYGLAAAPEALLRDWRIPVNRWGGNTADRYNWKLGNAWNTGNDWFFRNVAVEPDAWRGFLQHSKNTQGTAILTVPLVGYVAKDTTSYSYALGKYGKQAASEPGNPDIGNGRVPGGRLLYGNDPTDANRKADPEFIVEWLTEVRKGFPELVGERRLIISLGNEPMLWNKTHRDVHPEPVTYDEYLTRYTAMARRVRSAMPEALLAGPELWGWPALFESARDRDEGKGLDRRMHGNQPFLPWFLQQLKAHEARTGECLLDVVTVHYYPQGEGIYSDAATPTQQLQRMACTRSLWDTDYRDPSWINDRIALIPRVKKWIVENYPGRKLGITEYNWGGQNDISGAIALADVLGIFGREQLDLGCYWSYPPDQSLAAQAFALYRNVDGQGAAFGALGWSVTWDGPGSWPYETCSVYAAEIPGDDRLTVVAINKMQVPITLSVRIEAARGSAISGYRMDATTPGIVALEEGERPVREGDVLRLTLGPRNLYHLRIDLKK